MLIDLFRNPGADLSLLACLDGFDFRQRDPPLELQTPLDRWLTAQGRPAMSVYRTQGRGEVTPIACVFGFDLASKMFVRDIMELPLCEWWELRAREHSTYWTVVVPDMGEMMLRETFEAIRNCERHGFYDARTGCRPCSRG